MEQIKCLMWQLIDVLDYLHRVKRMIHRDIKCSNLLVSRNFELKLADFGMALLVCGDQCGHSSTKKSIRVKPTTATDCTDWYRPPELWAVAMDDQEVGQDFSKVIVVQM